METGLVTIESMTVTSRPETVVFRIKFLLFVCRPSFSPCLFCMKEESDGVWSVYQENDIRILDENFGPKNCRFRPTRQCRRTESRREIEEICYSLVTRGSVERAACPLSHVFLEALVSIAVTDLAKDLRVDGLRGYEEFMKHTLPLLIVACNNTKGPLFGWTIIDIA